MRVQKLFSALLLPAMLTLNLQAQDAYHAQVTVFSDRDFGGRSQSFGPGVFRADIHQMDVVGNDTISSITVPFGMSVDVFDNVDGTDPIGTFGPGHYNFVGDDLNDRISKLSVHNYSNVYFSTDAPDVPSIFHLNVDDGGLHVRIDPVGTRYYKRFEFNIPQGCDARWHESTKGGDAGDSGWDAHVANGKLFINLWVESRAVAGPRKWIGVQFSCK